MKKTLLRYYLFLFTTSAWADPASVDQTIIDQQFIHQQERQQALEDQLTPGSPDVRLMEPVATSAKMTFPVESPCFNLTDIQIKGISLLPSWLPLQRIAGQAKHRCLGPVGINLLMAELQNRLISHGYVTTRVVAPAQNLSSGVLQIMIVEGKVRHIDYADGSDTYAQLYTALPARADQLLDLRDIEQGLENLQHIPGVTASMKLYPGDQPGESDIVITRKQDKFWRVSASVDDSGSKSTGRYQGNVTLSLDNLLSLSDLFYLSLGQDLQRNSQYGSKNYTAYYAVPWGYWSFNTTLSHYDYSQTVSGLNNDYRYGGKNKGASFQLSRVLHRNDTQKTAAYYALQTRDTRNYVNDVEVEVQRRNTTHWKIGLDHRHHIDTATVNLGFNYQRGVRWFGAQPAPEEFTQDATALAEILRYSATLSIPFTLLQHPFAYRLDYQKQMSHTPLTPQDRFSIGGRWTVRGFDGELSLSADQGWWVRNELAWQFPHLHQSLYLGIDYGQVGGRNADLLLGTHLAGMAVGIRGSLGQFNYDVVMAKPLSKPDRFQTDNPTFGFSLNWSH